MKLPHLFPRCCFLLSASGWFGLAGCDLLGGDSKIDSCDSNCRLNETRCSPSGGLSTCIGPSKFGCNYWDDGVACNPGQNCVDGRCLENSGGCSEDCGPARTCKDGVCVCLDPCHGTDKMCAGEPGWVECQGPDDHGCHTWSALLPCPTATLCRSDLLKCVTKTPAECASKNECDYVGQKFCQSESKYRECKLGGDGCLILDCGT